jgi:hypothetical protein
MGVDLTRQINSLKRQIFKNDVIEVYLAYFDAANSVFEVIARYRSQVRSGCRLQRTTLHLGIDICCVGPTVSRPDLTFIIYRRNRCYIFHPASRSESPGGQSPVVP